jgi:hypothetical protein
MSATVMPRSKKAKLFSLVPIFWLLPNCRDHTLIIITAWAGFDKRIGLDRHCGAPELRGRHGAVGLQVRIAVRD